MDPLKLKLNSIPRGHKNKNTTVLIIRWFKYGLFARKLHGQQNVQHNENTDEGAQKAKLMSVL